MDINNFENIRAGVFPVSVDVLRISNHNTCGVIAKVYLHKENDESYVQVRKHNRDNFVFIATYRYRDIALSDYYLDSSILFDSRVWSHSLTRAGSVEEKGFYCCLTNKGNWRYPVYEEGSWYTTKWIM